MVAPADNPQSLPPARRARRAVGWTAAVTLVLLLLVLVITSRRTDRQVGHRETSPTTQPDSQLWSEPQLINQKGVTAIGADPDGIAPPQGARRRLALRREFADELSIEASYAYSGTAAEAVDHYRRALRERGFTLASDRTTRPGLRVMVFTAGPVRAVLALRSEADEATIDGITITVLKPKPDP